MEKYKNPFELFAEDYDQWFNTDQGKLFFLKELSCLRQVVDIKTENWLEVGVGSGRFAEALKVKTGIDISPSILKIAATRGIDCREASGENLPFTDGLFDGVLMVCSICFLDDPRKTLRECWRVLNDNGQMVIGFIPSDSPWGVYHSIRGKRGHAFYSSARFYTSEEIKALAEGSGFACLTEHGCVLPIPDELLCDDDISGITLRDESFVVLSFFKENNGSSGNFVGES